MDCQRFWPGLESVLETVSVSPFPSSGARCFVTLVVLFGMPVAEAAPLGLLTVAAGSVAAGPRHLAARIVNHRLGVSTELAATTGAVVGALASGVLPQRPLV